MEKIKNMFIVFILCLIASTNAQLNYICTNPQSLYDSTKNVVNACNSTTCNKCDSVSQGFYYFKADAKIPNFCPTMYVCSTEATYWSNDTQPSASNPGPFNITLCLSLSLTGNDPDCNSSCSSVQAAFCSNINAVVYELSPVPLCNVRYCFQEFIPCGKNESSRTGYQPCIQNFPFNQLPNGTTGFVPSNTTNPLFTAVPGVYAKCTIKCPSTLNCSNVTGDVFWLSGGSSALPFYTSTLLYDSVTNELYGYASDTQWKPYLNTYIRCNILPRANGVQPYFYLYTSPYYFGLYLAVNQSGSSYQIQNFFDRKEVIVTLHEANPNNNAVIEIHSTIPILCSPGRSCNLQIAMTREDIYNTTDLYRVTNCAPNCGGCQQTLNQQSQEDPTNKATWNILATVEPSNLNEGTNLYINFFVMQSMFVLGNFWNYSLVPTIKVMYSPLNMPMNYYAYSHNDPHMRSFDGRYYEFQGLGDEYLMVENNDTLLRIHAIMTSCNQIYKNGNGAFCNDRLYIQSIDDLIIHDIRYGDSLYYKDLNTTSPNLIIIPFDKDGNAVISKPNMVQITRKDGQFKIITHFGTVIYIDYSSFWVYSGNFKVFPSKMDYQRIWGLLGNYDKDPSNDLNTLYGATVSSDAAFFEAYRIKAPRPFMSQNQYYNLSNSQLNWTSNFIQYCMCVNTTGSLDLRCPLGLVQIDSNKYLTLKSLQISMKTLDNINEKIERSPIYKAFYKNENEKKLYRSRRQALTDSCEKTLNISVLQNSHSQNLINLTQLIIDCKFDFNASNLDIWAKQYYRNALHVSTVQLLNDKNNFVNVSGKMQSQKDLLSKLCLNNCSNHGNCTEMGVCSCYSPYSGEDCSIDSSIPANIYNSTIDLNKCDLRKNASCRDLVLIVDRTSPSMTVTVTSYYRNDSKNLVHSRTTSSIISFSDNLIYVELSLIDQIANGFSSVIFYKITLKDLSISAPFFYAIYDSHCQTCDDQANCFVNVNTCNINNDCYKNDEVNPNNLDEICNYTNSQYKWSPKNQSVNYQTTTPSSSGLVSTSMAPFIVTFMVTVLELVTGFLC